MTILDDLRKVYVVRAVCPNCKAFTEVKIKKGITVEDYFNSPEGTCSHCGCTGLTLFKPREKENDKKR